MYVGEGEEHTLMVQSLKNTEKQSELTQIFVISTPTYIIFVEYLYFQNKATILFYDNFMMYLSSFILG